MLQLPLHIKYNCLWCFWNWENGWTKKKKQFYDSFLFQLKSVNSIYIRGLSTQRNLTLLYNPKSYGEHKLCILSFLTFSLSKYWNKTKYGGFQNYAIKTVIGLKGNITGVLLVISRDNSTCNSEAHTGHIIISCNQACGTNSFFN